MTHFGMFCPPATGHLDPVGALGRELQARGHRVTVFQVADVEKKVRADLLDFCPVGKEAYPIGSLPEYLEEIGRREGWASVRYSIECRCGRHVLYIQSTRRFPSWTSRPRRATTRTVTAPTETLPYYEWRVIRRTGKCWATARQRSALDGLVSARLNHCTIGTAIGSRSHHRRE